MSNHDKLTIRHSWYSRPLSPKSLCVQNACKSDINLPTGNGGITIIKYPRETLTKNSCGEYYKKYDYDEVPVKDNNSNSATGDSERISLTNSELDKLEKKVLENVSEDLRPDNSFKSLDSKVKFFKATVQQIFDNYNNTMQDFEMYKKKFHEILAKNRTESVAEMEDFIKEMIQLVMSSETSITDESLGSESGRTNHRDTTTGGSDKTDISSASGNLLENLYSVVEAYKNDNYLTDSTVNEKDSKTKRQSMKAEIFNIYLLNSSPLVQIKMRNRNLLSEINIRDLSSSLESDVASAENLKKLEAKRRDLETYVVMQQEEARGPDREIPIRISSAKKNLHLDEDFVCREKEENKSLMSKICSFLCKKFRKNSFG